MNVLRILGILMVPLASLASEETDGMCGAGNARAVPVASLAAGAASAAGAARGTLAEILGPDNAEAVQKIFFRRFYATVDVLRAPYVLRQRSREEARDNPVTYRKRLTAEGPLTTVVLPEPTEGRPAPTEGRPAPTFEQESNNRYFTKWKNDDASISVFKRDTASDLVRTIFEEVKPEESAPGDAFPTFNCRTYKLYKTFSVRARVSVDEFEWVMGIVAECGDEVIYETAAYRLTDLHNNILTDWHVRGKLPLDHIAAIYPMFKDMGVKDFLPRL